jgi:hypothetical protein
MYSAVLAHQDLSHVLPRSTQHEKTKECIASDGWMDQVRRISPASHSMTRGVVPQYSAQPSYLRGGRGRGCVANQATSVTVPIFRLLVILQDWVYIFHSPLCNIAFPYLQGTPNSKWEASGKYFSSLSTAVCSVGSLNQPVLHPNSPPPLEITSGPADGFFHK